MKSLLNRPAGYRPEPLYEMMWSSAKSSDVTKKICKTIQKTQNNKPKEIEEDTQNNHKLKGYHTETHDEKNRYNDHKKDEK